MQVPAIGTRVRRARFHGLTSLRFFAALAIVVHHGADFGLIPAAALQRIDLAQGVTFFFVLSGFVLTYTYGQGPLRLRRFYGARLARIWPAAALSILLVPLLLPRALFLSSGAHGFPDFGVFLLCVLLLQAVVPVPNVYFAYNAVTWSVSVEAVFYLLFPALLVALRRHWQLTLALVALVGLALVGLAAGLHLPDFSPSRLAEPGWHGLIYIHPLARLGEFVIGMLAARLFVSPLGRRWRAGLKRWRWSGWLELVGVVGLVLLNVGLQGLLLGWSVPLSLMLRHWLAAAGFAGLILVLASEGGGLSRGLRWAPLVLLGEISYSLYLFHMLILHVVVNSHPQVLALIPGGLRFPVVVLICLIIAFGCWSWVEKPVRAFLMAPRRVQLPRWCPKGWGQRQG
jgi:peptidoglycan/LPS O-acetylase OafA/YrhL